VPAKGKSRVTDAQRRKIAAGRVAGRSHRAIAADTGLALKTVDHHATDPRVNTLILRLKHKYERELGRGWRLALLSLLRDLRSKDHVLQIAARRDLLRFLTVGDPPLLRMAPADTSGGDFTLEELLISYRKVTVVT
jgi:hypothetical protein